MSHNLTLTRGRKKKLEIFDVRQTPSELTLRCRPFLRDGNRVYEEYRDWLFEGSLHGVRGSWERKQIELELESHLSEVRRRLREGWEWGWT